VVGWLLRAALAAAAASAAVAAAAAAAAVQVGVAEDATKFAGDGGASLFPTMAGAGLTVDRVDVFWDERHPLRIAERPLLDRLLPVAAQAGVRIVVQVRTARARAFARQTALRVRQFAHYLGALARAYPQVSDFIVGNEPNQPRFFQPQFDARGAPVAPRVYERVLAAGYDALKRVSPGIDVIGVALSARGNDDPSARDNVSSSPVRFLAGLGKAYRASGRRRPLMDAFAFHPYPSINTDPPAKGYLWPNAGIPNLDRIRQALWDAFHGTGQPTRLPFVIDEIAWQAQIPPELRHLYHGRENVPLVDEQTQAHDDVAALQLLACDPDVRTVLFFRLIDSADLDRFQSGFLRLDGSPRPALDAVKAAVAAPPPCPARRPWRHATGVVGASIRLHRGTERLTIRVSAAEGTIAIARVLRRGVAAAAVSVHLRRVQPGRLQLRVPRGRLLVRVTLRAETNLARSTSFVRTLG
jgi:hypothetical protein